jgi:hypothetical protein
VSKQNTNPEVQYRAVQSQESDYNLKQMNVMSILFKFTVMRTPNCTILIIFVALRNVTENLKISDKGSQGY